MGDTKSETPSNNQDNGFDAAIEDVFAGIPDDQFGGEAAIEETPETKPERKDGAQKTAKDGEGSGAKPENIDDGDDSPAIDDLVDDESEDDGSEVLRDDPEWAAATEALLMSGLTAQEIAELPSETVLKMGKARIKPPTDDAGGEEGEGKPDAAGGAKAVMDADAAETPPGAVDAESLKKIAVDALASSKNFDESEVTDIAGVISAVVDAAFKGFKPDPDKQVANQDVENLKRTVDSQANHIAEMKADRYMETIGEQWPELDGIEGKIAAKKKVFELVGKGMRFNSVEDAIDAAALMLWGSKRQGEIRQHQKKVSRARKAGSLSTSRSARKDDTVPGDPWDAAADAAFNKVVHGKG